MANPRAVWAALLLVAGCSSPNTKFGTFDAPKAQFAPSALARACTQDSECVEVESTCGACCPGGSAINKRYLDVFKMNLARACATVKVTATSPNCTCVMAAIRCLKGQCSWDYHGPDPSTL